MARSVPHTLDQVKMVDSPWELTADETADDDGIAGGLPRTHELGFQTRTLW
jgi:hypothetical protein